jgi:aldehyde dehydrogenase (NAD+)
MGQAVAETVAKRLGRCLLELGGNNAMIVTPSADLELATRAITFAAAGTAGQRCTSAGNIIVDRRVLPAFRDRFVRRASSLKIGSPLDEQNDYGPFINQRFLERWIEQRATGLADGASLLLDGKRIGAGDEVPGFTGDAGKGFYGTPRLFDNVRIDMRVAQEECFGPTVNLIEVDGLDEAIRTANGTPYGLSSAIYTRDAHAMLRFKEEIKAGMTSINNSTTGAEAHLPFGGNGWSGNGTRESGIWVLDSYTRWQAVNVDLSGRLQKAQIDLVDPEASGTAALDRANPAIP